MALGDIVEVLDSKPFTQQSGQPATLRKRSNNIVVLASNILGSGLAAVRSIYISYLGIIKATPETSRYFDKPSIHDMGLIHWDGDIFALTSQDDSAKQHLWTFSCNEAGTIPEGFVDYLELFGAASIDLRSDLLKIHGSILVTGQSYSFSR
ncbi:unnamed protein product, partial [marine sediment metagenome]